jgi:two-component sensor histidine kinase
MVNLSLDLFRMEEGTYRLRAQAVDLGAIVQTVTRELQAHARSKQVRLALDLPREPVHAQGEELLCYSTLANLLKNALEASPDGGEVRITLRRSSDGDGDAVALDIHNAGQVALELRDRFFEKYATHGKAGGTGLGAYSARLMARVQRGSLRMRSDEQGTTLSLRLPVWHSLMPEFLSSRRTLAQELAAAALQGERETVRVTAHKLAGSLAMYGFKDASRASLDLERAARVEGIDELQARCEALERMIAQAHPEGRPVP